MRMVTVLTLRSEVSVSDRNMTDRPIPIWYCDAATMLKQAPTDHVRVENVSESDFLRPDAQRLDGLPRRKNEVRSARARSSPRILHLVYVSGLSGVNMSHRGRFGTPIWTRSTFLSQIQDSSAAGATSSLEVTTSYS